VKKNKAGKAPSTLRNIEYRQNIAGGAAGKGGHFGGWRINITAYCYESRNERAEKKKAKNTRCSFTTAIQMSREDSCSDQLCNAL